MSQTLNAIFLTILKGSLGIYYSQINTYLAEVCLHYFFLKWSKKNNKVSTYL